MFVDYTVVHCSNHSFSIHFLSEFPLTLTAVSSLVERSIPDDSKNWSLAYQCFGVDEEEVCNPATISKTWLKAKSQSQNKEWWKLGVKLLRCCNQEKIADVHRLMKNVVTYNNKGKIYTRPLLDAYTLLMFSRFRTSIMHAH